MPLPQHLVLIPDGNRRWAAQKGKPAYFGHAAGAKSSVEIFEEVHKLGIKNLTFWGCSVGNLTGRSRTEVAFLYKVFGEYFKKLGKRPEIKQDGIRVRFLGRWREFLPAGLRKIMLNLEKDTEKHSDRNLTFLMAYDGRDEMQSAIRNLVAEKIPAEKIGRDEIKNSLWTRDLPPVDLVVRTGGEPHWSAGLLMWDVSEAQLYFTETHWPAFDSKELKKALALYAETERRHGK